MIRLRWAYLAVVTVLTGLATRGLYRHMESTHVAEAAWMNSDVGASGLTLQDDRDPDHDGLDLLLDDDADGDGVPNARDIVTHALSMNGRRSDPMMGRYDNVLGRVGFVVCIDVVVESWMAAGLSLPALLMADSRATPAWFAIEPTNSADDPYFVRRVRNFRDLFEHESGLEMDTQPRPGDVAFYGEHHAAVVVSTNAGRYTVVEAYGALVGEASGADVEARTGESVFGRVRTGRGLTDDRPPWGLLGQHARPAENLATARAARCPICTPGRQR